MSRLAPSSSCPTPASLLQLWHHGALCERVVAAPGVAQPLSTLCNVLSLAHGVAAVPMGAPDCGSFTPLQQCRAFYLWSLGWGGVALPLLTTARFERRLRRRLGRAAAQQGAAPQRAQQPGQPGDERSEPGALQAAMTAYVHSLAAWLAACSLEALLRPALGWRDAA